MVKREFSGKRDLTYNKWHRTLGNPYYMMDVDCVEWRSGRGIVAIIERTLHYPEGKYSQQDIIGFKQFEIIVMTELSEKLQVPAYLVLHNLDLTRFDVYRIKEETATFWRTMNHEEYGIFIRNL